MDKREVYEIAKMHADTAAKKYGVKPEKLAEAAVAVARIESSYDPGAENSHSTARGLMQVLICTQRWIEDREGFGFAQAKHNCDDYPNAPVGDDDKMFNPIYNMKIGMHYLAWQVKRYGGNWQKAIHSYNQGSFPGFDPAGGKKYASKVMKHIKFNITEPAAVYAQLSQPYKTLEHKNRIMKYYEFY